MYAFKVMSWARYEQATGSGVEAIPGVPGWLSPNTSAPTYTPESRLPLPEPCRFVLFVDLELQLARNLAQSLQGLFGFSPPAQTHEIVRIGHDARARASLQPELLPSQHPLEKRRLTSAHTHLGHWGFDQQTSLNRKSGIPAHDDCGRHVGMSYVMMRVYEPRGEDFRWFRVDC